MQLSIASKTGRWRSAGWRFAWAGLLSGLCAVIGWITLHEVPGLAPALADGARALVGDEAVTDLEQSAYAVEDAVKRRLIGSRKPRAYWQVKAPPVHAAVAEPQGSARAPEAEPVQERQPELRAFRPLDVGPLFAEQAAAGDGLWLPAEPEVRAPGPLSYKTLLHPDRERSYAELFVVALDLRRVELHAVPGRAEPEASGPAARGYVREAMVPPAARPLLLAAFNGGFKSTHGHFGMQVEGVTLAPARPTSCTIAEYSSGELRLGTFSELPEPERMTWFRQTPRCMVERGQRHPHLVNSKNWGATVDGETVIRRSAIGLDASGTTLFVGISNSTTADALARGMQHAGAHTVAQLDVNYSFPRFLFYKEGKNGLETLPVAEGFVYTRGQYVEQRSERDFFYVTRKPDAA